MFYSTTIRMQMQVANYSWQNDGWNSPMKVGGSRRKWAGQWYENSGLFHSSVIFVVGDVYSAT